MLEADAWYRALVEQSLTGIYLIVGKRFLYVNQAFAEIFGYRTEEIIGRLGPAELTHPEDRLVVARHIRDRLKGAADVAHYQFRGVRKDGSMVWIEAFGRRIEDQGHPAILGTLMDITQRRQDADRMQSQLRRLGALRSIDMAITASLDIHVTLNVILDEVLSQLTVDAADVLLLDAHTQRLRYAAGRGFRTGVLQHTSLALGEGHAGQVALDRRPCIIENLNLTPGAFLHAPLLASEEFVAYYAVPLLAKGHVNGVLELWHRTPLFPDQAWCEFLEALAGQTAIAVDSAALFNDLERTNVDLKRAYDRTIEGWSRALDLRDEQTEGHAQRVADLTERLARRMGVPDTELVHIRRGALLHDIGKMGVPDAILMKSGPLTDDEWTIMRKHPVYARDMLAPIDYLRPALDIPYSHHEKWDGTGYPLGLNGVQIPLSARIFAVVDVWDALRSSRPYRVAVSTAEVVAHIREQSGKHFDPAVVEVFLSLLAEGAVNLTDPREAPRCEETLPGAP
ncbi:MAG TPA: HD domain-containing phosphohydrolase [bacterium]|nr:HD domain-containing phosphohydrolase [bacterium]